MDNYTDFETEDERGTFSRAIDRGIDQNQAMLYATVQAFGQATGIDLIEKWGEEGLQRNIQQILANPPEIREWDNVDDFGELGTYLLEVIGEQAPQLGMDAVAAIAGGGIAGIAGKRMLAAQIGKGLKRKLGDVATKTALDNIKKRGAQAGAGAAILGQTIGETQMELDSRGLESPGTAFTAGVIKGGLEAFGLGKILGLGKRVGRNPADLVREVAGAAGIEAGTEGTQTIVDFLAVKSEDPAFDPLSEESLAELKESMIRGGIIGGGVRTVTAGVDMALGPEQQPPPVDDPSPEPRSTIDAQYAAMRDPSSAKTTVEVTAGSPLPSQLDDDTYIAPTQNGVALTQDPEIAQTISAEGGSQELMGTLLFDKPEGKDGTDGTVVTARDANGAPITEVATNAQSLGRDLAVADDMVPTGGTVEVTDAATAVADRAAKVEEEDLVAKFLASGGAIQQIPYDDTQERAARGPTAAVVDTTQDIDASLVADDLVEDGTLQDDSVESEFFDEGLSAPETTAPATPFEFQPSYKFHNQAQEAVDLASIQDPTAEFEIKKVGHLDFRVQQKSGIIPTREEAASKARKIKDANPDRYVGIAQTEEGYRLVSRPLPPQLSGDSRVITRDGREMTSTERVKHGIAEARRLAGLIRRGVQKQAVPASENNKLVEFTTPDGVPITLQAPAIANMGMDLNQADADRSKRTELQSAYEGYLTGLAELQRLGYRPVGGRELNPGTVFYSKTRHGGFSILQAMQEAEDRTGPVSAIQRLEKRIEAGGRLLKDRTQSARTPADEIAIDRIRAKLAELRGQLRQAHKDAANSPRGNVDGRNNDEVYEGEARPEPMAPQNQTIRERVDAETADTPNREIHAERQAAKQEKPEESDIAPEHPASVDEYRRTLAKNEGRSAPPSDREYATLDLSEAPVASYGGYAGKVAAIPESHPSLDEAEQAIVDAVELLGGVVGEKSITLDKTKIVLETRLPEEVIFKDGSRLEPGTKGTVTSGGLYTIVFLRLHADADDIAKTVKHELIGHYGLARFHTGSERRAILNSIVANRDAMQREWGAVETLYPDISDLGKAEEIYAAIAEDADIAPPTVMKAIRRAITALLRRIGILRAKTPAEQVREYVDEGVRRLREAKPRNPDAKIGYLGGGHVARVSEVFSRQQLQRAGRLMRGMHNQVMRNKIGGFLFTAHGQLKAISPELAAKIYQDTNTRNTGDAYWTGVDAARGVWFSRLSRLLRNTSEADVKDAFAGLARELPTEELTPLGKRIRQFIDRYHNEYLSPRLPTLGKISNYFPRLYDTYAIETRRDEFEGILASHGVEDIDQVVKHLVTMQNPGAVHENRSFMSLRTTILQQRQLNDPALIAALVDAGFLNNNPITTLSSYIHSSTKRAEWEDRFGGYQRIEGYNPPGDSSNLTEEFRAIAQESNDLVLQRIAMENDLYPDKDLLTAYRDVVQKIKAAVRDKNYDEKRMEQLLKTQEKLEKRANPDDVKKTLDMMHQFGHIKRNRHGQLGLYNPNQKLRKFILDHEGIKPEDYERVKHLVMSSIETAPVDRTTWHYKRLGQLRAFESLRVLAMSGIASIPEVAAVFSRANQQLSVVEFGAILKNVGRHYKDYRAFAEDIGAIQLGAATAMYQEMYGPGVGESGKAKFDPRNILPHMFKLNGNDFIVNFTKAVATEAAKQFLKRTAEQAASGDRRAIRYLESLSIDPEHPLTAEQVLSWAKNEFAHPDTLNGQEAVDALAAQSAALRFLKEAVLEPNSAERPPWAGHPLGSLVMHLKSYMYAFNKKVMLGMYREVEARAQEGDATKLQSAAFLGAAAAMFMFFGGLSDELKQRLLSLGEYGTYFRSYRDPGRMIGRWTDRSGLNSLPFSDFFHDLSLRSAAFAAGPVFSHIHMLFLEDPHGDKDALKRLLWSMPITSQFYGIRREIYETLEERGATE